MEKRPLLKSRALGAAILSVLVSSFFSFVPTALAVKTAGSLGYSILVYTDDPFHSVGENGPMIALEGMGYSYTCF